MGAKTVGAYGCQSYQLHAPFLLKCGSLNRLEPSGHTQGLLDLLRANYSHSTINDDDDGNNKNNAFINNDFSVVGTSRLLAYDTVSSCVWFPTM
jgi:hypothetical protein